MRANQGRHKGIQEAGFSQGQRLLVNGNGGAFPSFTLNSPLSIPGATKAFSAHVSKISYIIFSEHPSDILRWNALFRPHLPQKRTGVLFMRSPENSEKVFQKAKGSVFFESANFGWGEAR